MGAAIAEVVPVAIGLVLVNPLPVMAIILLLFSPRAGSAAPAFVAGWAVGMLVVFGLLLFVLAPENLVGSERDPSTLSFIVRLALGLVLLFLAMQRWRSRSKDGEEKALPSWIATLERASPLVALGLGALLSGLNPKNLAFTINAVVIIAQASLTTGQKLIPVLVFVLVASVGVAAPWLWYVVARESAAATLTAWRTWLTANYGTVMAVVFLLFGVILAAQGLAGLLR
jgi:hypothetical protein